MAQHLALVPCPHLESVLLAGPVLTQSSWAFGRATGSCLLPLEK